MKAESDSNKKKNTRSRSSSKKKKTLQKELPSIIPDYLLKQVQDYHKKTQADPKILARDQRNRQTSDQLRNQRQRKLKQS